MANNILLVEDNYGDIILLKEALKYIDIELNLNYVRDGNEAILYLKKQGKYRESVIPDLIYLDLNLPRKTGKEVLQEIRNDNRINDIPVVILTTSGNEDDIYESYLLGANSYMTKQPLFNDFVESIKSSVKFFLKLNYNS
jgi:two-component system, chemotaxis family, response regulator Rcp1